jgi:hypothetical protein
MQRSEEVTSELKLTFYDNSNKHVNMIELMN